MTRAIASPMVRANSTVPMPSRPPSRKPDVNATSPTLWRTAAVATGAMTTTPAPAPSARSWHAHCLAARRSRPHRHDHGWVGIWQHRGVQRVSVGDVRLFVLGGVLAVLAGVTRYADLGHVLAFVVSGLSLAVLAALVGRSVDNLGDRFGSGATGVLQSALGNLPELFVCIFALRAHLLVVVEAAIIGSILGNILLVLGLAFLVGGLRNGVQRCDGDRARTTTSLMLLAVAGMLVPSLASYVHTAASRHERALSVITA